MATAAPKFTWGRAAALGRVHRGVTSELHGWRDRCEPCPSVGVLTARVVPE